MAKYRKSAGLMVPLLGLQSAVLVVVGSALAYILYSSGAARLDATFDRSGAATVTALAAPNDIETHHATILCTDFTR